MKQASNEARETRASEHILPAWVVWVQAHILLSALIVAEAYILGILLVDGWVANIEDPTSWGIFHGIGVVLFFATGFVCAGVALFCSANMAEAFQRGSFGGALGYLFGLLMFTVPEVWASIRERSAHIQPSPADTAVLAAFGIHNAPISPTVLMIALLPPFATLFVGFAQRKAPLESAAEQQARYDHKLARAQFRAALRQQQARGFVQTIQAATDALATPKGDATSDGIATVNSVDMPLEYTDNSSGKRGGIATVNTSAIPRGFWTRNDVQEYAQATYGVALTEMKALVYIQRTAGHKQAMQAPGRPWIGRANLIKRILESELGNVAQSERIAADN